MSFENQRMQLPTLEAFKLSIVELDLCASNLHGIMCGFLCARADNEGERYLRAVTSKQKNKTSVLSLFTLYTVTQQFINTLNFEFRPLLPTEDEPLIERACAFGQWCEGFIQGLAMAGVEDPMQFNEEEAQEAYHHITEFAQLDTDSLTANEEDEAAFMEVSEYTRMAVLRLHADLRSQAKKSDDEHTH